MATRFDQDWVIFRPFHNIRINYNCILIYGLIYKLTHKNSVSETHEYQEYLGGGYKGGQCAGLTILPPSCNDCLEIWEPQPPGTLRACPGITLHFLKKKIIYIVLRNAGDGLGMWRVWGRRGGCIGSWWGNQRERVHWGDLGVDGWIILGWISRRWDVSI